MADYRRWRVEGGTYFFTLVAHSRANLFSDPVAKAILGKVFRECIQNWPFSMPAVVLLPDHLHAIWTLPPGDAGYPARWGWIKKEFTKRWLAQGGTEQPVSEARQLRGDHGVWQPRYWEHTIEDEHDFDRHFDYAHYNPVKHGHVTRVCDWPESSFHRWVRAGVYDPDWGSSGLDFSDLDQTAVELESE